MNGHNQPSSVGLPAVEAALLQLLAAVRAANGNLAPYSGPLSFSLSQAFNEFLLAKARAGRSDNYLRVIRKNLAAFCDGREARPLATITAEEIDRWLCDNAWSARTRKGAVKDLRTAFAWCMSRGMLAANPAMGVDIPTQDVTPPAIHTPAQVCHILETARRLDKDVMRCLAVKYFAGLRTSEAVSLDESQITVAFIEVTAAKAKTRRRRLVEIRPVLRAWLAEGGVLPLRQVNNRLRAVYAAAGVYCPRNVARHSFVSYHLAAFGSAAKTALEAGHTEQMLFNHYREIVTPEVAQEFWALFPAVPSPNGHTPPVG